MSSKSNAGYALLERMCMAIIKDIAFGKNDKGLSLSKLLQYMADKIELGMGRKSTNAAQEKTLQTFQFVGRNHKISRSVDDATKSRAVPARGMIGYTNIRTTSRQILFAANIDLLKMQSDY